MAAVTSFRTSSLQFQDCPQTSSLVVLKKLVAGNRFYLEAQSFPAKPGSLGPVLCLCLMVWMKLVVCKRSSLDPSVSHMGSVCVSHGQCVSHMGGVCLTWAVCVSHMGSVCLTFAGDCV